MSYYLYITVFGFISIIYLTLRDIRIYHRTKIESYRKGALKGMLAGAFALVGMGTVEASPQIGMIILLVAIYFNGKGARKVVFNDAPLIKRLLGETNIEE